ncbi:TAXI family TRAP transporter solute-binding subunit [Domibacillus epiphyticus]|uniref:C4-dicarboxylate ABC transporter substrate-binding protein n=1 Tax=Domibacillus epiphyticus TaxID=1714355 RepID=A0A1V2A8B0_9BACI|nr:TAXI family TRAP transporter solute-binding subunit [Domibacillus epiphyticus]OMP67206.1 hypothetical protein BTO28_07695 [Domibacillus epiphyticus]
MKKRFLQSMIALMSSAVFLAGCGNTAEEGTQESSTGDGNLKVTIAGGSAGGLWSTIGEGIGETIKRTHEGATFTYQPGQDGANIITVDSNQADFGIVSSAAVKWAYEGEKPYPKKVEKLRTVAFLHAMPYHFIVSESSGIESIEQITKEKIPFIASVNTKDSPMEMSNRIVLESYGTSYEDIQKNGGKIQFIAPSKSNDQIKDKKLDGTISPLPTPAGNLVELSTNTPIKLLPISEEAVKEAEEKLAAKPYTIKAGTYPFVKEDVPTFAIDTVLVSSTDVSEEVVYEVTKSMYEQLDYLYSVHQSFKDITKETITDLTGAPLHPGAEKFYKEVGILK